MVQADLSWTNPISETGFQVLRSITPTLDSYSLLATLNPDVTSYSDTAVITTTYSYRVKAFNDNGEVLSPALTLVVTGTNIGVPYAATVFFPTPSLDSDWSLVAAGNRHTIGLKNDGLAWSWGWNNYGQLGHGDYVDRGISYPIGSPATPSGLISGAIGLSQIVLTWTDTSNNEFGFRLERGVNGTAYSPIATVGIDTTTYLDTGLNSPTIYYYRVCAYNNLGDSPYSTTIGNFNGIIPSPVSATAVSSSQIDIGWTDRSNDETGFTIERKIGQNGSYIQIGTVAFNNTSYSDITATGFASNTIYYYRVKAYNTAGDSNYSNAASVIVASDWSGITAGNGYTIGLRNNGAIWSWGSNVYGYLGLGDTINRLNPSPIGTDSDWSAITARNAHTLALKLDGTIWSWGYNAYGQLGLGDSGSPATDRKTPTQIGTLSDWSMIAAGGEYSLARKTNGALWAWGNNNFGQLGQGDIIRRTTPTAIGTDSDWSLVSVGVGHNIARKTNNTLWVWGWNYYGQLGLGNSGTGTNRSTPTPIGTDSDWSLVAAGYAHTIGCKNNGTIWSWGYNHYGNLGLENSGSPATDRKTPTQIGTDSDWSLIAVGYNHNIGIKTNGLIWAWGQNSSGSLGLGDLIQRNTPSQMGTNSDWSAIAAGNGHTIGLKSNGLIWAWGLNGSGQLGLGDISDRNIPTLIIVGE